MNKNIKTNNFNTAPKSGKGALGFIFSVVLLDVMGLGLLPPIPKRDFRSLLGERVHNE